MKTIIIGIGNPIRRDDGVGIRVAQKIRQLINGKEDIEVIELSAGGLRLMEAMADYDKAIVIDAIITGQGPPGAIQKLNINNLAMSLHTSTTHDTSLASAIEIGKKLGIKIPSEIIIYGVEIADVNNFGENMTEAVESAIPFVAEKVLKEFKKLNKQDNTF